MLGVVKGGVLFLEIGRDKVPTEINVDSTLTLIRRGNDRCIEFPLTGDFVSACGGKKILKHHSKKVIDVSVFETRKTPGFLKSISRLFFKPKKKTPAGYKVVQQMNVSLHHVQYLISFIQK